MKKRNNLLFALSGDSMRYHNSRPFSAWDQNPDPLGIHCARAYMGGWWYKNCYKTNLNGVYGASHNNQVCSRRDLLSPVIVLTFPSVLLTGNSLDRLEGQRCLHSLHRDEVQTIKVLSCNSWLNPQQSLLVLQP